MRRQDIRVHFLSFFLKKSLRERGENDYGCPDKQNIIKESFLYLARAVTISVRYNLMRRQTAVEMGMPETTIMDYANSQRKLLPLIGACFVNHACGRNINTMYVQFVEDSKKVGAALHVRALRIILSWD